MQKPSSIEAKKRLFSIKRLAASPKIVQEVIALWKDPNTSMQDYQNAIGKDPALTTEVMRIVNSPFYGLKNQVTNLRMALSMLGLRETYRIVSNRGFLTVFKTVFPDADYDMTMYWKHCQKTANTAFALAEKFLPESSSEAYVAGLLHDVGKLAMAQFFQDEWQALLKSFVWEQNEGLEKEEELFGITHAELGAALLVRWNIPKEIVLPVRHHHDPLQATEHQEIVRIVYFAEKISTYLLAQPDQKSINEYFVENSIWYNMINEFPQYNILEDKDLMDEMRPIIEQEM